MAEEVKTERPKYPIKSMDTGQKVKIDAGFRYMVSPEGNVMKTPLPQKMTDKEKEAVKKYSHEKQLWKRQKMQKSLNYAKRRGEIAAKKLNKVAMKEVNVQLKAAKNAGKTEAKNAKVRAKIAALEKKLKK